MKTTNISNLINPVKFLSQAVQISTTKEMDLLLNQLPIVSEHDYQFASGNPEKGWIEGKLHWVPLGRDRGNAGRIKLADEPENPIAERVINSIEALIELMRRRELLRNPNSLQPLSPREAVMRYFSLPALEELPKIDKLIDGKKPREYARELAKKIVVRVNFDKVEREFVVFIEDEGIGQPPKKMHETLLSLGSSDKGDKPYLIGLFGQGGSSTYAASVYSWCVSRQSPDLLSGEQDGVGWTAIKQVYPKGRRDPFFAYLAANPTGEVLSFSTEAGDAIGLKHGSRFAHLKYDFSSSGSAVMRRLYYMLNHILYNPVLPFDLYAGQTLATIYGNGYRLSNATVRQETLLDKVFTPQSIC